MKKEVFDDPCRIILENHPYGCWLKGLDGKYVMVNKTFADSAGVSEEEIMGKESHEIFSEAEAAFYTNRDQEVIQGRGTDFFEYKFRDRWQEEFKRAVRDSEGNVIGITGFFQDITRRKVVEDALKESERSMSVLLSNLPGVAYRCRNDKSWTMTFLSQGCQDLTGYTAEELIEGSEVTYYDLIHSDYRSKTFERWEQDVAENRMSSDEYVIRTKSGESKWIWEQSIPIPDENGDLTHSEGFIQDITNIKKAEQALKESEDRFKTIFERAPMGIGVFSSITGRATQINPKFSQIIGRSPKEILETDWKLYTHPEDIPINLEKLRLMREKKITGFSLDKRYIKPDGSILWANMVIAPFDSNEEDETHLCMIEDITFSKNKEQETEYLSYHDSLTGLYNRRFFEEEIRRADVSRKLPVSIIMGDVNGLKLINDSFGHGAGDMLLKEAARILHQSCREEDFVARIGGDEFVILLYQTDDWSTERLCQRISQACKEYGRSRDKKSFFLSISLGHATKKHPDQKMEKLLMEAEDMLYKSKHVQRGKTRKEIMKAVKIELVNRNYYTHEGFSEILQLSRQIGLSLNLSKNKIKQLELLLEIHDIGKLTLSEELSKKKWNQLSDFEKIEYRKHAEAGFRIAQGVNELKSIKDEVHTHHENWDGTGFPRGISGSQIPILARITRLMDEYADLTEGRPVKDARQSRIIQAFMEENSGKLFDPKVVKAFLTVVQGK